MALISELAITPDIFLTSFCCNSELEDELLCQIKDYIMTQAVVRDLRCSEWSNLFQVKKLLLSNRAKELLKKLKSHNRLYNFPGIVSKEPVSDLEWCAEALETHKIRQLTGIITTDSVAELNKLDKLVASISKLRRSEWWKPLDSSSVILCRNIDSYLEHLNPILLYSNSIMFIDGNIDLSAPNYADFIKLIEIISTRERIPHIEIHRQEWSGSSKNREYKSVEEWQSRFMAPLQNLLSDTKIKITVYIWDRVHDRYLLSDLVGVSLPYGFDTNRRDPGEKTVWSRLTRTDTENFFRHYDPAFRRNSLKGQFTLG